MKTVRMLGLAGIVAVAAAAPASVGAQLAGKFIVTPYVGAYMPSTDLGRLSTTFGGAPVNLAGKQRTAIALGTNASYWLNDRFAIEGGFLYSGSDFKGTGAEIRNDLLIPTVTTEHANIWLGSTKLMMQVLPPESDFNLRFGIGPAIITRSGTAYKDAEGKVTGLTDVGAAMSLCTRFGLSPNAALRFRIEDYIYQSKLGFQSYNTPADSYVLSARTQNDFVISLGLQLFVNP
jgi:outer membrane protein W